MTDEFVPSATPILADEVGYLIATAARAPSIHNTQPWLFRVGDGAVELYADPARKVRADPVGREMLISCGSALFGLRLAVRSLGYLPVVDLLPDAANLRLLATVRIGAPEPATPLERQLLEAVPHRHTHRGPFTGEPMPAGLVPALQHDALAEGAALSMVGPADFLRLAQIVGAVGHRQDADPLERADVRQWTRVPGSHARDGIPATAIPAELGHDASRLGQRDFDLGRGIGKLPADGPPPAATAIVTTLRDGRADWLRAGQALHRLLLHAATKWVFASLHTRPLEAAAIRRLIRDDLALAGAPQLLLQFGVARTAQATPRRTPSELVMPGSAEQRNEPAQAAQPGTKLADVTA